MNKEEMEKLICTFNNNHCLTNKCVHYGERKIEKYIYKTTYTIETIYISYCKLWWNKGEQNAYL